MIALKKPGCLQGGGFCLCLFSAGEAEGEGQPEAPDGIRRKEAEKVQGR